ncbi:MAG: glycosyltransferase family 4 protein, partial [Chloroflexaceae bacterium]|nr:glycosyltransferase family 4 protein [Chloroflexaceae bacterium]
GYVPRADFEAYVAAADVCVNLRHPTAGETSASLLRLLGAGRPTLVSRTGAFAELPPHVAIQIDTDAHEGDLMLAVLRLLAEQPALAAAIGDHARAYVAEQHSLDGAALGYVRFLARLYGWPAVQRIRSAPLWELTSAAPAAPPAQPVGITERRRRSAAADHPPLCRW